MFLEVRTASAQQINIHPLSQGPFYLSKPLGRGAGPFQFFALFAAWTLLVLKKAPELRGVREMSSF